MKYYLLIFTAAFLLGVGCTRISTTPKPTACIQEARQCSDGSYVGRTGPNCEFGACPNGAVPVKYPSFSKLGVTITPLQVLADSRCPKGAQCIWAGTVVLKVNLEYAGNNVEEVLDLSTPPIYFSGKEIALTAVTPGKEINKTILPNEYSFTFGVTQPTVDATGAHSAW